MAQAFRDVASRHSQQEALVCGDLRATYGQLRERVTGLACGLHELGIGKGDKVAAILPPSPEFIILFFTVAELGAVIVPINPQLRPHQLRHILQDAEPSAAVISQAMDGMLTELADLPTHQSTNLPIYQSTNLPIYQSTNLPIYQSTNIPTYRRR